MLPELGLTTLDQAQSVPMMSCLCIIHSVAGFSRCHTGAFPLQATFRVRAMDRYLNLVKLPANDLDAAGPKGFQAVLLGPSKTEQVCQTF